MICFLTSSTVLPGTDELNPANGFLERLRLCMPKPCRAVFVCADPDGFARTDRFAASVKGSFEAAGFSFQSFSVLDRRTQNEAASLIAHANCLILAGGHVPTQNRFFAQIGLKDCLSGFDGVLIGISAGSMNCASVVYAQPELQGEALDPTYERFLPGLGLTKQMLLPHYQMLKDETLDSLRLMEEITYPDSSGRSFLAMVDGSYLYLENGRETICGEAYRIENGVLSQLCVSGASTIV